MTVDFVVPPLERAPRAADFVGALGAAHRRRPELTYAAAGPSVEPAQSLIAEFRAMYATRVAKRSVSDMRAALSSREPNAGEHADFDAFFANLATDDEG